MMLRALVAAAGLLAFGCTVYPEGQPDAPATPAAAAAWEKTHTDTSCMDDCLADATLHEVCEERCNK